MSLFRFPFPMWFISAIFDAIPSRAFCLCVCGFLCAGLMACSSGSSQEDVLTFTLSKRPFAVTVFCDGVLEAKVAQTLSTPRLPVWRQLEISYLAPEGTQVKKDDVVVKYNPQSFENDYLSALNDLELAQAEAQRQEADLNAQRLTMAAEMESAKASVAFSKFQLAKLEFVAPRLREVQRLEMRRDSLRAEKVRKRLASTEAIQKEEIAHQKIKINQAERKLSQAQESIDKLILKAPTDGIVVHENSPFRGRKPQEGDNLYPSEPVVKIPDVSVMQVKLQVGEIDAQKLKKDQRAEVNISSLKNAHIAGKVTQVAKRAQPISRGSKVKQVEVVVALDTTWVAFTPGLSAEVRIFVGEQPDQLVAPLECVFQQDSTTVVYVKEQSGFVSKPVTVVEQNANFAVLEGDLEAGAALALKAPGK